jgi:hypothetical protein
MITRIDRQQLQHLQNDLAMLRADLAVAELIDDPIDRAWQTQYAQELIDELAYQIDLSSKAAA